MSECTHNCSTCKADCSSRKESLIEEPHSMSKIKKVIGVVSGKGGVGKSLVTSLMAVYSQRNGFRTAILDADITGPSIPKAFGLTQKADAIEEGILPVKTNTGIEVMSVNLLLEDENQPVVWRGPVIAGAVKQFWHDVVWEELDYLFIVSVLVYLIYIILPIRNTIEGNFKTGCDITYFASALAFFVMLYVVFKQKDKNYKR